MRGKYFNNFLLVLLLTLPPVAFAQETQAPKTREVLVKESIANLDSNDLHVAAQAARDLGYQQATEAVPALLRVVQSRRLLWTSEHVMAKEKNGSSMWVVTDARGEIIDSLGMIGDQRAVPVLKKYLRKPLKNDEVYTGNVAHALYRITGKSYEYKDFEGQQKLYVPSPIIEEEVRSRFRPDLKATEGLTALLEIEGHGDDLTGAYWLGSRPLLINLAITNHSKRVIEFDAAADNFLFSSVPGSGELANLPADLLRSAAPRAGLSAIQPGQKLTLRWIVEILKKSPLSRGWVGYVNVKCVYTAPRKSKTGAIWRGKQLISNSVKRYYYPAN